MKKSKTIVTLVGLLGMVMALSTIGCSSERASLAGQRLASIERQNTDQIKILWSDVYRQDGRLWVQGVLQQRNTNNAAITTHVDVRVLAADGSVTHEAISDDVCVPRHRVGKGPDWTRFRVMLPDELDTNARIVMAVHSGSH